jgi:hypothetical protein
MSPIEVTLSVVQFLLELVGYSSRLPLLEDFQRRTPRRAECGLYVLYSILCCSANNYASGNDPKSSIHGLRPTSSTKINP